MPGFDILDHKSSLDGHLFLEASAGTGKTFAIEMALVRFIVEKGVSLDQILVVTFTKAATIELKTRLRKALEKTYQDLTMSLTLPDWMVSLDAQQKEKAVRIIRNTLFSFDEAHIYTIHRFCHLLLQEFAIEVGVSFDLGFERSLKNELGTIVKDVLRTKLSFDLLSAFQFEKVIQSCQGDFNLLIHKITQLLSFRMPIAHTLSFRDLKAALAKLIAVYNVAPCHVKTMLTQAAFGFKGLVTKAKTLKEGTKKAIELFSSLFDTPDLDDRLLNACLENGDILLKFSPENRLKKAPENSNSLFIRLQNEVFPLFRQAMDPTQLIALLARELKPFVDHVIEEEELFFFEDLLKSTSKLVKNPACASVIREQYEAVLIDEFQDTDPLQWEIFSTLFCDETYEGRLFVVGDPKQAIYAFRGADIYTYLAAKKRFGEQEQATLSVNYRSHPGLVKALNTLFSSFSDFFPLPRKKHFLTCPTVTASANAKHLSWNDLRGSVHFFATEAKKEVEKALFTFIAEEILTLTVEQKIPLQEMAVLVKDRFQADRFAKFCKAHSIPIALRKTESLIGSLALNLLIELLEAVINPKHLSSLLKVLGGPLFGQNASQLEEIVSSHEKQQAAVKRFYILNEVLSKEGIIPFFHTLFKEKDLERELYSDLLQLATLSAQQVHFINGYIPFYEALQKEDPEKEEFKKRQVSSQESVQVMTIHTSKGLEFDIVFPIGLIATPTQKKGFFLSEKRILHPFIPGDEISTLQEEELEAEKMRLFYVAATRAKKRLYLPFSPHDTDSIMHLFVQKLCMAQRFSTLFDWVEHQEEISFSLCPQIVTKRYESPHQTEFNDTCFSEKRTFPHLQIQSFSSIAIPQLTSPKEIQEDPARLPLGPEVGLLLHQILENIDFQDPSITVSPFVTKTPYASYEKQIAELIFNALNTQLTGNHASFRVKDIAPDKMHREMEFLFPHPDGAIKGVIDLFFEYQGLYYLLDWKSNYLESYTQETLKQEMHAHDYLLQESLYRQAAQKYIALFDKRPFEELFGGSFYLFLRGLPENGVYYLTT